MVNFFRTDGWVKSVSGPAVPGAQIYVCTQPANVASAPPTPLANIFSDPNGLVPITQPILTDGFGHYDFYAIAATYTIVVAIGGLIQQVYPDQSVGGASSGGTALVIEVRGTALSNQLLLNFESSDSSVIITDAGNGLLNFQTPTGPPGAGTADYMLGAGMFYLNNVAPSENIAHVDLAGRVYCHRFNTPFMLNFTKMSFTSGSNLLGGGNINFGLYSDTGSLLFTTGPLFTPNSVNFRTDVTLSPAWAASPGSYILAWSISDAGNTNMWGWDLAGVLVDNGGSTVDVGNRNGVINFGYAANSAGSAATAMPATLGSLTGPVVGGVTGTPAAMFQK